jgi:hypothetical protein
MSKKGSNNFFYFWFVKLRVFALIFLIIALAIMWLVSIAS